MRKKLPTLFGVIAAACACAGWSPLPAQSPTTRSGDSGRARTIDACSVLTREEIKSLSNHDPGSPRAGGPGETSICYWESSTPKGSVILYPNVDPHEPRGAALKQMLDRGKKAHAVSGLGDDAFVVEGPSGDPSGTLYVRVGHYRLVMYRAALPSATSESVLPTLVAFAKAAVPRLRRAA